MRDGVCVTTGARNSVLRAGTLRAVWPSFYQRSNGCIRFDSEHLTTSYKRAQAKPKTGRLLFNPSARARPGRPCRRRV